VSIVEDGQTDLWVSGLSEDLRVIVQGQDFVKEGQLVEAVPAPAAARG
jgi:multidrug efflux system membrane fusion protein